MTVSNSTSEAVAVEAVEDADVAVAEKVKPFSETFAAQALSFVSKVGDQPPMRALCGAVIAVGFVAGNRRLAGAGLRMLAAHTIATASKDFVKKRIDRSRPDACQNGDDHRIQPGTSQSHDKTSFPSGHSAGAVAVAAAFARSFPKHRASALSAAGVIAIAQVPRRSHYLSDVVVGSAIGLISEAVLNRLVRAYNTAAQRS